MKKSLKISLAILLVFLILISIAVFYDYLRYGEEIKEGYWEMPKSIEYESTDNYVITDTLEGKMVVNENVGLSFMVPEGWGVEVLPEEYEVEIFTPGTDITGLGSETTFPVSGCVIRLGVAYFIQDFSGQEQRPQIIAKQIQEGKDMLENVQEIVSINNYSALKTTKFKDSEFGRIILIELPMDNAIYHFGTSFSLNNKEECENNFGEFLETILINI